MKVMLLSCKSYTVCLIYIVSELDKLSSHDIIILVAYVDIIRLIVLH